MSVTTDETIRFACKCGQEIEAPLEMNGQLVDCPSCGQPVMATRPVTLDPPRPKKTTDDADRERGERIKQIQQHYADKREPFEKTRETAGNMMTASVIAFVLAVISAVMITGAMSGGLTGIEVASGFFGLGILFALIGQLMHIRAGIEETNFLMRKATREREVESAVEKMRGR